MYWSTELGHDAIRQLLSTASPRTDNAVNHISTTVPQRHLPETVASLLSKLPSIAGTQRLHLLVIESANLEAYLQDAITLHVASIGHGNEPTGLNNIGKAIARPVINSSTIPDMLEYIEDLIDVRFGIHLTRWKKAYKLRCAAAHNGGVMTSQQRKKMPDLPVAPGAAITLNWDELKAYLDSAFQMAQMIDERISTRAFHDIEARWVVNEFKKDGVLPTKKELWGMLHTLGFQTIDKKHRERIERDVY